MASNANVCKMCLKKPTSHCPLGENNVKKDVETPRRNVDVGHNVWERKKDDGSELAKIFENLFTKCSPTTFILILAKKTLFIETRMVKCIC